MQLLKLTTYLPPSQPFYRLCSYWYWYVSIRTSFWVLCLPLGGGKVTFLIAFTLTSLYTQHHSRDKMDQALSLFFLLCVSSEFIYYNANKGSTGGGYLSCACGLGTTVTYQDETTNASLQSWLTYVWMDTKKWQGSHHSNKAVNLKHLCIMIPYVYTVIMLMKRELTVEYEPSPMIRSKWKSSLFFFGGKSSPFSCVYVGVHACMCVTHAKYTYIPLWKCVI